MLHIQGQGDLGLQIALASSSDFSNMSSLAGASSQLVPIPKNSSIDGVAETYLLLHQLAQSVGESYDCTAYESRLAFANGSPQSLTPYAAAASSATSTSSSVRTVHSFGRSSQPPRNSFASRAQAKAKAKALAKKAKDKERVAAIEKRAVKNIQQQQGFQNDDGKGTGRCSAGSQKV